MDDYVKLIDAMNEALENKKLTFVPCSKEFISAVVDAIEQLVRVRDAAVADLKSLAFCCKCKHNETTEGVNDICLYCREDDKWEWRGVQE